MFSCCYQSDRTEGAENVLAAEWESFERLIHASNDEQTAAAAAGQESCSIQSSDDVKTTLMLGRTSDQTTDSALQMKRKRVFREAQSDSGGNSNSDSEDESHPTIPAVAGDRVDRHSTSSQSSHSEENKSTVKPASSDSDSSDDDDEKPTKLPLGECCMTLNPLTPTVAVWI